MTPDPYLGGHDHVGPIDPPYALAPLDADDPTSPCELCGSELGLPLEVGGDSGHRRDLVACRSCELHDPDALARLVDDSAPIPVAVDERDCPHCRAPTCDCHRPGRALGAPDTDEPAPRFNAPREGWA